MSYALDNGGNLNFKGHKNQTPLHIACAHGTLGVILVLIHRSDLVVDCEDDEGKLPLHYFCGRDEYKLGDEVHISRY